MDLKQVSGSLGLKSPMRSIKVHSILHRLLILRRPLRRPSSSRPLSLQWEI
jgi:hypothetical protein